MLKARWLLTPALVFVLIAGLSYAAPITPGTAFSFEQTTTSFTNNGTEQVGFAFDITDADITSVLPAGETLAETLPQDIRIDSLSLMVTGDTDILINNIPRWNTAGTWVAEVYPETTGGGVLEPIDYPGQGGVGGMDILGVGLGEYAGADPANPNAVSDATGAGGTTVVWTYKPAGRAGVSAIGPVPSTHIPLSAEMKSLFPKLGKKNQAWGTIEFMLSSAKLSGTASAVVVPEPGTLLLLGAGLLSLLGLQLGVRRRKRTADSA